MSYEKLVEKAIRERGALLIRYRNTSGNVTVRVVEPTAWVHSSFLFRAYCHLRKEERSFKTRNILEVKFFSSAEEAISYQNGDGDIHVSVTATSHSFRQSRTSLATAQNVVGSNDLSSKDIPPIEQVTSEEEWTRLLLYYKESLEREYVEQFSLQKERIAQLPLSTDYGNRLLKGEIRLDLTRTSSLKSNFLFELLQRGEEQSIYLSTLFLGWENNTFVPLFLAPIEIQQTGKDRYSLQADEYEVNYAMLKLMGATEEEIASFLTQLASQPNNFHDLKTFVVSYLEERLGYSFEHLEGELRSGFLCETAGIFLVTGNNITGSLIQELGILAQPEYWMHAKEALKYMLKHLPEHEVPDLLDEHENPDLLDKHEEPRLLDEHEEPGLLDKHEEPDLPDEHEDTRIYITPVNDEQRKVVNAARDGLLTVVTGPPGTGKSQVVLNLIANAFLNGKSVLFASKNNQAVNVVTKRLIAEYQFPCVRTGNKEYREKAASQMLDLLTQQTRDVDSYQQLSEEEEWYRELRDEYVRVGRELEKVRDFKGEISSSKEEEKAYLLSLTEHTRNRAQSVRLDYRETEASRIRESFSVFLEQSLELQNRLRKIRNLLRETIDISRQLGNTMTALHWIKNQVTDFGNGLLDGEVCTSLSICERTLFLWHLVLEWVSNTAQRERLENRLLTVWDEKETLEGTISSEKVNQVKACKELFNEIDEYQQYLQSALERLRKSKYLSKVFVLYRTVCTLWRMHRRLGWQFDLNVWIIPNVSRIVEMITELTNFYRLATLYRIEKQVENQIDEQIAKINDIESKMPTDLLNDCRKIDVSFAVNDSSLLDFAEQMRQVETIQNFVVSLRSDTEGLSEKIRGFVTDIPKRFSMFVNVNDSSTTPFQNLLSIVSTNEPVELVRSVQELLNVFRYWRLKFNREDIERKLSELREEDDLLKDEVELKSAIVESGKRLFRFSWENRFQQANADTIQRAKNFAKALDPAQKSGQAANYFYSAMKLFPVWATTNLSVRSNFPLESGLFDLVIIDEASQCDIPSAIPLLYRAKQIVVIGDPHQLRHVVSLKSDGDLVSKYHIGQGFAYSSTSLYDRAEECSGKSPGVIFLRDHYRSDARIIEFSNSEFYSGRLKVRTDLTRLKYRKSFLNQYGGVYWLNVSGETSRPRGGGAVNYDEASVVQKVLSSLPEMLEKFEIQHAGVGIVTPFRKQEDLIRNQGVLDIPDVRIGTAHKFQGDERDIVIFSPTISSGTSEGTIKWLQSTKNLLNVAVTRARLMLIVVGDFNYCRSLEEEHVFRRLAEYVSQYSERIVDAVDELAFFNPKPFPVVGYITDPHNPMHNRTTLRRFIASLPEFVWWVDHYFTDKVFDLFLDVFQDTDVTLREVKLLTNKKQTQGQKPALSIDWYKTIRREMHERGIDFELRLLENKEIHDRFLLAPNTALNMPPFSGAYGIHHHVSEFTYSSMKRDNFSVWWDNAIVIE